MFNPFEEKPKPIENFLMDWKTIYPKSYYKNKVDPYTKTRIILMNGIEAEALMFSHQFHRHCTDNNVRRDLAMVRRTEQMQQKHINWLKPIDETPLETTIGYEHVAVDLTAWLAQNEPDPYVKQTLDFILLEDFDHLYRYANLLDMDSNIQANNLVKNYVEIIPGRPTIAHHRHPYDTVSKYVDFKKADIRTKLNIFIITAGEQQTMNFYNNIGNTYYNDLGRQLYLEVALVEEEHVTQYGSLIDPRLTWFESLLLHEYTECYLYYSFYESEVDSNVKSIWEMHLDAEIAHLHKAAELLQKHENKSWHEVIPGGQFPNLLMFRDTREYVRKVLSQMVEITADKEDLRNINDLQDNHTFFWFQNKVNYDINLVASHVVIDKHKTVKGEDYRWEMAPHPVESLRNRKEDNVSIGRIKQKKLVSI
ncbi:hypothetical protein [Anaerocellum diazotrophicum]|uniref:Uncharacterized protein n=1 Tax=Caldicellulosiruptor diazotrophicus TaxID=2806205 RepID=A0ABN6E916_9FIRM|nr:hypothetical protein [Caldicellulosiruptor diazotrophicus]BCS82040.1 hypothetical protein CaldiYA01_20000 [Caldicellulosiruptor diazotrophicus]